MGFRVVVVTGVPGAGKSTLARSLSAVMGSELLSLDDVKERLYASDASIGNGVALRLMAEAELWDRIDTAAGSVVVDIWVAPGRDDERVAAALNRNESVVEVLCRVPADMAVQRYLDRVRSGPHQPADEATLLRIQEAVGLIQPLGIGRSIEVDAQVPLDAATLSATLEAMAH